VFFFILTLAGWVFLLGHCLFARDWTRLSLLLAGISITLATAYAYRGHPGALPGWAGCRYGYIPAVTLVWTLILTMRTGTLVRPIAVNLILITMATFSHFRCPPLVDFHWRDASKNWGGAEHLRIPINPPGWFVEYHPPSAAKQQIPLPR
jgi:hypothetical protein